MLDKLVSASKSYSPLHINVFNELFYSSGEMKLIESLPNIFTKLDFFNVALHKIITNTLKTNSINLMEIASGNTMDRWKTFMEIDEENTWNVVLTDFSKHVLPNLDSIHSPANFSFQTQICSLFDTLPELPPKDKFNVLLSSYTFDNLWLTGDVHLTKVDNTWYRNLYKLDTSRVQKYIPHIQRGSKLEEEFFKNLFIKTKREKVNMAKLTYGNLIEEYFKDREDVQVNYPSGLIHKIHESFENTLKAQGLFITADLAVSKVTDKADGFKDVNDTIKIKIEHYGLAKYILNNVGYHVKLMDLFDFISSAGIETPVPIHDHFILIVSKQ